MRVTTCSLRRISVSPSSCSQVVQVERKVRVNNIDSLRIQYSITAHLSGRNGCDVTKLVNDTTRTEQYSLLEPSSLLISRAAISSSIKLHC